VDFEILKHFKDVPTFVILNKVSAVRKGTEEDTKDFDLVAENELPQHYQDSKILMSARKQLLSYKTDYPNIKRVLVLSLQEDEDDKDGTPIGLSTLYEATLVCLDICLRLIFVDNVNAFANNKVLASVGIISSHVAVASGVAWIPVPAVDSIAITAAQISMILALFKVWGVAGTDLPTFAVAFMKGTAPALISFGIGYGIAQLLKFIPIYGSIAGGALSMTVASVATVIIGIVVTLYLRLNVTSKVENMTGTQLEKKVKEFISSPDVQNFLKSVPSLFASGSLTNAVDTFKKETPNL